MATASRLVEHALESSSADDCSVILRQTSSANLRWANKHPHDERVDDLVPGHCRLADRRAQRNGRRRRHPARILDTRGHCPRQPSRRDSRDAAPAEDANDIVSGIESEDWNDPPGVTSVAVFDTLARDLGESFTRARLEKRLLYGTSSTA